MKNEKNELLWNVLSGWTIEVMNEWMSELEEWMIELKRISEKML